MSELKGIKLKQPRNESIILVLPQLCLILIPLCSSLDWIACSIQLSCSLLTKLCKFPASIIYFTWSPSRITCFPLICLLLPHMAFRSWKNVDGRRYYRVISGSNKSSLHIECFANGGNIVRNIRALLTRVCERRAASEIIWFVLHSGIVCCWHTLIKQTTFVIIPFMPGRRGDIWFRCCDIVTALIAIETLDNINNWRINRV